MKILIYISIIILAFISCKKESIPELVEKQKGIEDTSAKFYIKGMLGTDSVNLESKGGYYMFSSHDFDSPNDVYIFSGELKQTNCSSCGIGIKIKLNNYVNSPNQILNFNTDTTFKTEVRNWNDPLFTNDYLNKAEIIVNYNNGEPLRSSYSISQVNKDFMITNLEYFNTNENGESTVKVSFQGSVLIPTSSPASKLFTFEGVYAFAFPE